MFIAVLFYFTASFVLLGFTLVFLTMLYPVLCQRVSLYLTSVYVMALYFRLFYKSPLPTITEKQRKHNRSRDSVITKVSLHVVMKCFRKLSFLQAAKGQSSFGLLKMGMHFGLHFCGPGASKMEAKRQPKWTRMVSKGFKMVSKRVSERGTKISEKKVMRNGASNSAAVPLKNIPEWGEGRP